MIEFPLSLASAPALSPNLLIAAAQSPLESTATLLLRMLRAFCEFAGFFPHPAQSPANNFSLPRAAALRSSPAGFLRRPQLPLRTATAGNHPLPLLFARGTSCPHDSPALSRAPPIPCRSSSRANLRSIYPVSPPAPSTAFLAAKVRIQFRVPAHLPPSSQLLAACSAANKLSAPPPLRAHPLRSGPVPTSPEFPHRAAPHRSISRARRESGPLPLTASKTPSSKAPAPARPPSPLYVPRVASRFPSFQQSPIRFSCIPHPTFHLGFRRRSL